MESRALSASESPSAPLRAPSSAVPGTVCRGGGDWPGVASRDFTANRSESATRSRSSYGPSESAGPGPLAPPRRRLPRIARAATTRRRRRLQPAELTAVRRQDGRSGTAGPNPRPRIWPAERAARRARGGPRERGRPARSRPMAAASAGPPGAPRAAVRGATFQRRAPGGKFLEHVAGITFML